MSDFGTVQNYTVCIVNQDWKSSITWQDEADMRFHQSRTFRSTLNSFFCFISSEVISKFQKLIDLYFFIRYYIRRKLKKKFSMWCLKKRWKSRSRICITIFLSSCFFRKYPKQAVIRLQTYILSPSLIILWPAEGGSEREQTLIVLDLSL